MNKLIQMREKIIIIEILVMVSILVLMILDYIIEGVMGIGNFKLYAYLVLLLFLSYYYSIIKSILGIILLLKNIIQKNISIVSKKILFLFIPALLLTIYIVKFSLNNFTIVFKFMGLQEVIESIILIIGCFSLLCYYLLNKTLKIKTSHKIMLAIMQPIIYFVGYFIMWLSIMT